MRYIGIDLAWGATNTTGVVVLEGADDPAEGATLRAAEEALTDDAAILDFVQAHDDGGGLLVAIDAPLVVPNITGRRPCEAILSRCLRRVEAGPHPSNRSRLAGPDGSIRGERIATAFNLRGIAHTPHLDTLAQPPRACFEVFPHPAHVALWELDKTLKYKAKPRRTRELRVSEFVRYTALLVSLAAFDPPLTLPRNEEIWWQRDPAFLTPSALKRHEDTLDALTCAYIALYFHRWGDARCAVVGDLENGYIVTPSSPAMRACFAAAGAF